MQTGLEEWLREKAPGQILRNFTTAKILVRLTQLLCLYTHMVCGGDCGTCLCDVSVHTLYYTVRTEALWAYNHLLWNANTDLCRVALRKCFYTTEHYRFVGSLSFCSYNNNNNQFLFCQCSFLHFIVILNGNKFYLRKIWSWGDHYVIINILVYAYLVILFFSTYDSILRPFLLLLSIATTPDLELLNSE